jgi:hypothetical protein
MPAGEFQEPRAALPLRQVLSAVGVALREQHRALGVYVRHYITVLNLETFSDVVFLDRLFRERNSLDANKSITIAP